MTEKTTCTTPPDGWACSRPAGHTGPCAATPLPGHVDRLRILAAAVTLTHEAQAAGLVLTIETRPQEPLAMGNYFMALDVRSRRDSPQQVAAIGQELGPHPQSRLYGAINYLMAHIGAHGSVDSDHQLVDDTMQALKAVDGGTFQPEMADITGASIFGPGDFTIEGWVYPTSGTTEAAAMAATVPAGWQLVPIASTAPMQWAFNRAEVRFKDGTGRTHPMDPASEFKARYAAMLKIATPAPVAGQPAEPSPADLQARIQELEEQLQPYLDAEAAAEALSARRSRVEEIADVLFPQFSGAAARSDPSIRPPQWHEKSWWWNGVGVKWDRSHLEPRNGTVCINLSSYVGGGDVEDVNVHMPVQWLEVDDWKPLVAEFIAKKVTDRAATKAASEAAEAQRQIAAAQATLARLTAPKGDSNG